MTVEKGVLIVLLIAILGVVILQAAPQNSSGDEENSKQPLPLPIESRRKTPQAQGGALPAGQAASTNKPAAVVDSSEKPTATPQTPKPAAVVDNSEKPTATPQTPKPATDEETTTAASLSNCWTCLLEAAEDICSTLLAWTKPNKLSAINLFSLFQEEDSDESTGIPANSPLTVFSNLFRFRRSLGRSRRSVPVQDDTVGDVPARGFEGFPVEGQEFLDLIHGFYLKMRDRFLRENPGALTRSTVDLYKRPNELVDVASYILGISRDRLVQIYERLRTKEIGHNLFKALDDRMAMLNGERRTESANTFMELTPTSISYFFTELLASVNSIATGLSELSVFALENLRPTTQSTSL